MRGKEGYGYPCSPSPQIHILQLFCPACAEGRKHAPVFQGGMAQNTPVAAVEGGIISKARMGSGLLRAQAVYEKLLGKNDPLVKKIIKNRSSGCTAENLV